MEHFPLANLHTVPLLNVARHLNKQDRRCLSQCTRRFRELIWHSEDESLDCRAEYNHLRINIEDCPVEPGQIRLGIAPKRIFVYYSIEELEDALALLHKHFMYVADNFFPSAVYLNFRTIHISSQDFNRIVERVNDFKLFEVRHRSFLYEKPSIRLGVAHDKKPINISNYTIADTILSNTLIESADILLQPDLFKEVARLCEQRQIKSHGETLENGNFIMKCLNPAGTLIVFLS